MLSYKQENHIEAYHFTFNMVLGTSISSIPDLKGFNEIVPDIFGKQQIVEEQQNAMSYLSLPLSHTGKFDSSD